MNPNLLGLIISWGVMIVSFLGSFLIIFACGLSAAC